jgi:hypothetical protein
MDVPVCTHGPLESVYVCLSREGTKMKVITSRQRSRYEYRFMSHFV